MAVMLVFMLALMMCNIRNSGRSGSAKSEGTVLTEFLPSGVGGAFPDVCTNEAAVAAA